MISINKLIIILFILIFIGFITSISFQPTMISRENIIVREPPHFMRRLGLSPPYCPFRDQYY